jgi:transposase
MYEITCPFCGYDGDDEPFEVSLCDETSCPRCGIEFEIGFDRDEEEDDAGDLA